MDKQRGPLVHMNGTGFEDLFKEYTNATQAIASAVDEARNATFHPRDYYPLGDDAWEKAHHEHLKHLKALDEAHRYFEDTLTHIDQQQAKKAST